MFQEPPNASTSCCEHPCLEIWHLVNPNIKSLCYSSWNPWMLAGDPKFWKINHQAVLPSRMPPIFSHGRGDALWHRVSHLHWCRSSVVDQGGTTSRKSSVCQRTDQRNISETYWNRHQGIPRFKKSPYKSQRSYFLPMQSVVPREKLIIVHMRNSIKISFGGTATLPNGLKSFKSQKVSFGIYAIYLLVVFIKIMYIIYIYINIYIYILWYTKDL